MSEFEKHDENILAFRNYIKNTDFGDLSGQVGDWEFILYDCWKQARKGYVPIDKVVEIFEKRGSMSIYYSDTKKITNAWEDMLKEIKKLGGEG